MISTTEDNTKDNADSPEPSPLRILLVEDSKGDALLIERAIKTTISQPHNIQVAQALSDALTALSDNVFDVVLLDRSLPDVEGFSGLHSIKNMCPDLPVVFLTGYKDESFALDAIREGAQDYLLKDKMDGKVIEKAILYGIIRKDYENELTLKANYDSLTGLANRRFFENRLEQALAKIKRLGGSLSILFLDLDGFKQINDTLGHAAGDQLLKSVGTRILKSLREYDTIARMGGDEFAVLLEETYDVEQCKTIAQKIINVLQEPVSIDDQEVNVGVSIGVARHNSKDSSTYEEVIKNADLMMYEAKKNNESAYKIFEHNT